MTTVRDDSYDSVERSVVRTRSSRPDSQRRRYAQAPQVDKNGRAECAHRYSTKRAPTAQVKVPDAEAQGCEAR